jgi:hypothetical protein
MRTRYYYPATMLVLALLVLACGPIPAPKPKPPAPDLIPDGSFEGALTGWEAMDAEVSIEMAPECVRSGKRGARVRTISGGVSICNDDANLPVLLCEPNTIYEFTAWLRGLDGCENAMTRLEVYGNGSQHLGDANAHLIQGWRRQVCRFKTQSDTRQLKIMIYKVGDPTPVTFAVDDVSLCVFQAYDGNS